VSVTSFLGHHLAPEDGAGGVCLGERLGEVNGDRGAVQCFHISKVERDGRGATVMVSPLPAPGLPQRWVDLNVIYAA